MTHVHHCYIATAVVIVVAFKMVDMVVMIIRQPKVLLQRK